MSAQRELSQQASGKGTAKPLGQMYASYESSPARMQDPWQRTDGTSHAGSEEVYPLMPGYTTSQLGSYSGYKSVEVLSGVSGQGIDRGQSSATYVMDDVIVDFGTVWNVEMPGKGEGKSANMNARTITTTANTVNTRTFKTTKRAVKRTVKDKNGNPVLDENGTPVEELVDVSVDANGNLIDDSGNVVAVLDVNGNAVGRNGNLLVDQDGHPVRLDSPDMSSSGMSNAGMSNSSMNRTLGMSGMGRMNSTGGSPIAVGSSMASENVMGPMPSQMQSPSHTFTVGHGPRSNVVGDPRSMAVGDPSSTSAQLARQKIMKENTSGNLKGGGAVNNPKDGVKGSHSILDRRTRMSNSSMNSTVGMSGMGRMNSTDRGTIAVGSSMASENVMGPMPSQMQSPSHTFTVGHGPRSNVVGDPRYMAVGDPSSTSAQLARQKIMEENTSGNLKDVGAVNNPTRGVEGGHSILDSRTRNEHRYHSGRSDSSPPSGKPGIIKAGKKDENGKDDKLEGKQDKSKKDEMDKQKKQQRDKNTPSKGDAIMFDGSKGHPDDDDEKKGDDDDSGEEHLTLSMIYENSSAVHSSTSPDASAGGPSASQDVPSSNANREMLSSMQDYLRRSGFRSALSSEAIMGKPASDDGEDDNDKGRDERKKKKRKGGKRLGDSDSSSGSESEALIHDAPPSAKMSHSPLKSMVLDSDDSVGSQGSVVHYPLNSDHDIVESYGKDSAKTTSDHDGPDNGDADLKLSILDDGEFIFNGTESTDGRNRSAQNHSGETVSPADVKALRDALAKAQAWNCFSCAVLWILSVLGVCVIVVSILQVLQNGRIESLEQKVGGGCVGIGSNEFLRSADGRLHEAIGGSTSHGPGQFESGGKDPGHGGDKDAEGGNPGSGTQGGRSGEDNKSFEIPGKNGNLRSLGKSHIRSRQNNGNASSEGAKSGAKPGADIANAKPNAKGDVASGKVAGTNGAGVKPKARGEAGVGTRTGFGDGTGNDSNVGGNVYGAVGGSENGMFNGGSFNGGKTLVGSIIAGIVGGAIVNPVMSKITSNDISTGEVGNELKQLETSLWAKFRTELDTQKQNMNTLLETQKREIQEMLTEQNALSTQLEDLKSRFEKRLTELQSGVRRDLEQLTQTIPKVQSDAVDPIEEMRSQLSVFQERMKSQETELAQIREVAELVSKTQGTAGPSSEHQQGEHQRQLLELKENLERTVTAELKEFYQEQRTTIEQAAQKTWTTTIESEITEKLSSWKPQVEAAIKDRVSAQISDVFRSLKSLSETQQGLKVEQGEKFLALTKANEKLQTDVLRSLRNDEELEQLQKAMSALDERWVTLSDLLKTQSKEIKVIQSRETALTQRVEVPQNEIKEDLKRIEEHVDTLSQWKRKVEGDSADSFLSPRKLEEKFITSQAFTAAQEQVQVQLDKMDARIQKSELLIASVGHCSELREEFFAQLSRNRKDIQVSQESLRSTIRSQEERVSAARDEFRKQVDEIQASIPGLVQQKFAELQQEKGHSDQKIESAIKAMRAEVEAFNQRVLQSEASFNEEMERAKSQVRSFEEKFKGIDFGAISSEVHEMSEAHMKFESGLDRKLTGIEALRVERMLPEVQRTVARRLQPDLHRRVQDAMSTARLALRIQHDKFDLEVSQEGRKALLMEDRLSALENAILPNTHK